MKAVIRPRDHTGVPNLRVPEGGSPTLVAQEMWSDSRECENNSGAHLFRK